MEIYLVVHFKSFLWCKEEVGLAFLYMFEKSLYITEHDWKLQS